MQCVRVIRVIVAFVCLFGALSGGYPPAHGQQMPPALDQIQIPPQMAISPYDPEFRADISSLNGHINSTDTAVKDLTKRVDDLSGEVREMSGSMKVYFWIIAGLLTGSIVLPQLKKRQESQSDE